MTRFAIVGAAFAAAVLASGGACAQQQMQAPQGQMQNPGAGGGMGRPGGGRGGECRTEIERVCAGVQRGGGRIRGCVEANLASFSPECQSRIRMREQRREERGMQGGYGQQRPMQQQVPGQVPAR